ncbi:selenoprotein S isoform X2 [Manduca sexta]|uniref:selenoprotein S isoform X2 n=1 Tax=Manduca sexta TaxID=7130 RepID=UPI00188F8617|nr:selenoprotein S isoform X2 [Manduca sexta]XP_037298905.1 selenoprotein S isoform X2 [Manduca sexta]
MESVVDEQQSFGSMLLTPASVVLQFLATYGWYVVGATAAALYLLNKLKKRYAAYRQAKEDAEYHKDPDKALARMEAFQRAREQQQEMLREASRRAREAQEKLAEKKRNDTIQRLKRYGADAGRRLAEMDDDASYLPLSGGASTSTYRAPKKKCPGGGCGR